MDVGSGRRGEGESCLRCPAASLLSLQMVALELETFLWHAGPDEPFRAGHFYQRPICIYGRPAIGKSLAPLHSSQ